MIWPFIVWGLVVFHSPNFIQQECKHSPSKHIKKVQQCKNQKSPKK